MQLLWQRKMTQRNSETEIVTCITLASNQMIFLMKGGINKQIALAQRAVHFFCSL